MGVYINDILVGGETYPNNETIFKEIQCNSSSDIVIKLVYENDVDISTLLFAKHYLDDRYPKANKILKMLYVPYSRMDRKIDGYFFSLKYFAKIINSLNFDEVRILDVHSSVSSGLLDRVIEISPQNYINSVFQIHRIDYVLYPDNGAMKRYTESINLPSDVTAFCANKKRDLNTGKITGFELINPPELKDKVVLIIDDLCAKGGTFIASAKLLKEQGVNDIYLYVSHCENSVFDGEFFDSKLFKKIYTTNSIIRKDHPDIRTFR